METRKTIELLSLVLKALSELGEADLERILSAGKCRIVLDGDEASKPRRKAAPPEIEVGTVAARLQELHSCEEAVRYLETACPKKSQLEAVASHFHIKLAGRDKEALGQRIAELTVGRKLDGGAYSSTSARPLAAEQAADLKPEASPPQSAAPNAASAPATGDVPPGS